MNRSRVATLLLTAALVARAGAAGAEGTLYQQAVHILGGNGNVVSRWDGPIRFTVIDGGRETPAERIVGEAAAIAGLEVAFPERPAETAERYRELLESTPPYVLAPPCEGDAGSACLNFVVVLATNEAMQGIVETVPLAGHYMDSLRADASLHCFFAPLTTGLREIRMVVVYVRDDLSPAMLETCLQEEIFQAFGLFGDYTGSTRFSFNNVVAPKRITAYDRALLAALYDPRVRPGYPVHMVATIFVDSLPENERAGAGRAASPAIVRAGAPAGGDPVDVASR